ncbi:hypothetical protein [Companilactobacillus ginsenosidimutans]|uniref:Uncharacterized protein n=1 Tax=Companilactobacillus ginsenosidimutans TaxID=1007676 RepID=A0A0H4QI69_9LACO|nr:hypothetical protein [Companilactobacillus ginsenosidimutans]AKP67637.1 hypothetical protein ABM34_08925 [Companilactobacillus ginsenosidimutans]
MKNLTKNQWRWTISILILLIIISLFAFNVFRIRDKSTDAISKITIPFSLIVNPKNIDKGVTPKSVNTDVNDLNSEKNHVVKLTNNIDTSFQDNKKLYFLSKDQQKSLMDKVDKQEHQYIYKITLLNFGRDHSGKYFTISCNQYNDTKSIVSYRYILHYDKNQIKTSKYIGKRSAKYPPQFIIDGVVTGNDGVKQSKSFMQETRTAIINSNLISNNSIVPGDFNQIAINIGLNNETSNKALYSLAKNANSRLTNFAVTGYELSDVPRYSRIYIKQINNDVNHYYTLSYDRNTSKFTSLKQGIISNRLTN